MFAIEAPFQAPLGVKDLAVWRAMAAHADQFSLALLGPKVTAEPGKQVRRKVGSALSLLPAIRGLELYASKKWLGTTARGTLVLVGRCGGEVTSVFQESEVAFRELWGSPSLKLYWEDVALYRDRKVILWTCTHEKEGFVYSSKANLLSWGLTPQPTVQYTIDAERFNADIEAEILAETVRHSS
jgi:hypothetical protein